jgi:hypothetical protein
MLWFRAEAAAASDKAASHWEGVKRMLDEKKKLPPWSAGPSQID